MTDQHQDPGSRALSAEEEEALARPHSRARVSVPESHPALAGAVVVALVALYWFFLRGRLVQRMIRQALRAFRENPDTWRKTWAFGGVTLTPAAGGEPCVAPQGSWRSLAETITKKQVYTISGCSSAASG